MLFIDIKVLSEVDALSAAKSLKEVGIEVNGSPLLTEETVKTLGDMNLKGFEHMILELQQTFLALKTTSGRDLNERI